MPRLAWFTPLPPGRSGIAAYSAELLPLLATDYAVDLFTQPKGGGRRTAGGESRSSQSAFRLPPSAFPSGLDVFGAHDFLWKHDRSPYDLIVYQLGNAACHDFMWPHLSRFPGLVVLHDGQLHHERSRALLSRARVEDYRAEFRYNHPDAPAHLPDLIESTLGGSLYHLYPMLRWVVRTARLVAVHSGGLAQELAEAYPGVEVRVLPMGVPDPVPPAAADAAGTIRQRHGVPETGILFAAFGLITPEKRISAALRGLAASVAAGLDAYLLLVGEAAPHYDAVAEARALGVNDRVRVTGYVPDEDLGACLLAADVCVCLRWPTSRETSATWVRAIAAGRPTVITELAHTTDVPSLDPRTWKPSGDARTDGAAAGLEPGSAAGAVAPVAVAVDVLDEENGVRLAMLGLATDQGLRDRLGQNARAYWQANHTMPHAAKAYHAAIDRAMARPIPRVRDLPAHLLADHTGLAREILVVGGVRSDLFE